MCLIQIEQGGSTSEVPVEFPSQVQSQTCYPQFQAGTCTCQQVPTLHMTCITVYLTLWVNKKINVPQHKASSQKQLRLLAFLKPHAV